MNSVKVRSEMITLIAQQVSMLQSNAAAYNLMQNSQMRMDLSFGRGLGTMSMHDVFQKEQMLNLSDSRNHLTYLYNKYLQEALEKKRDKDIKRSFSYFA